MNPVSVTQKLYKMWSLWREVPEDYRYLWPWFQSIMPGHYPLTDERPWITFKAISWLEEYLKPEMRVFEYGSGGSTVFFARRVKEVHAVEHEEMYFDMVRQALVSKGLKNCGYQLQLPRALNQANVEYSLTSCTSLMEGWRDCDFSEYVQSIDHFPDGCFDLVVVDGRSRISCLNRALRKVRRGGWIMLDNSERGQYEPGRKLLSSYRKHDFFGLVPSNLDLYQTSAWHLDDNPESRRCQIP